MRYFVKVFLGIFIVFLLNTILSKVSPFLILLFNLFSLVTIYFAIEKGEIYGSCLGAVCGILQDHFSFGVYGVAGLAKTITGYLAGYISRKIDVHPFFRSFIFILILVSVEFILWALFYSFIFPDSVYTGRSLIFFQPFITALLGSVLFFLLRKFKRSKP